MPRGDRTGPWGTGPMSGRGAGFCAGSGAPGDADPAPGRGFGIGFGRGRGFWGRGFRGGGWCHRFCATGLPGWMRFGRFGPGYPHPDPEQEKQGLRNRAEALESELEALKKRIRELETGPAEK